MPIYEYACPSCGEQFEKLLQRSGEEVRCPSCGAGEVNRRLSAFSVGRGASPAPACEGGFCSPCGGGACGLE